jgi:hypothetical protein
VTIGRCQRWSYRRPPAGAPRQFCPNAELFDEIAASQKFKPESVGRSS